MWPTKVLRQFQFAQNAGLVPLENVLHGPYNKLLNTLFPVDTDFTVIPNFQEIGTTKGVEYVVTFEVFLENKPVLVLELKRERDLGGRSQRALADDQLRQRLGDLIDACPLPILHGISAFGTKLCFYTVSKAAGQITPDEIPRSVRYVTDTAPLERWSYDILTADGEARFRVVVNEIIEGCNGLVNGGGEVED